jgi:hypothetical protein
MTDKNLKGSLESFITKRMYVKTIILWHKWPLSKRPHAGKLKNSLALLKKLNIHLQYDLGILFLSIHKK